MILGLNPQFSILDLEKDLILVVRGIGPEGEVFDLCRPIDPQGIDGEGGPTREGSSLIQEEGQ